MKKRLRLLIGGFSTAVVLSVGSMGIAAATKIPDCTGETDEVQTDIAQVPEECKKVTICHRDNNVKQPWGPKAITVAAEAADGVGDKDHAHHTGPVPTTEAEAQALKDAKTKWGDIIPPHDDFAGLNWTAQGQAIYNNDCQFVTGGQGGGETPPPPPPTTTVNNTTTNVQVVGGQGAGTPAQVAVVPQGGVGAGEGGASVVTSPASAIGMFGSLTALVSGAAWLGRRKIGLQ
jgi:hypothetical protein